MRNVIGRIFDVLLILMIAGCSSQPMAETEQVTNTPTLPITTVTPTSIPPHPLAITVDNTSSLKLQKTIGEGVVTDVIWSPTRDVIALAQDFNILFYDSSSLQLIDSIKLGGNQIAFSPNGLLLAIAQNNQITIWDIEKKEIVQKFQVEMARVREILYNSNGNSIAILGISSITEGDPPSVLELWSTKSWERVYTNSEKLEANMAFSPDGETLAFISNADLLLIKSATGLLQKIDLIWGNGSMVYINDNIMLKQYDQNQLTLMNLRTLENLNFINVEIGYHSGFRLSPDKRKIVFPEIWDDEKDVWITQVWDLETEKLLYVLDFSSDITKIDFSPNGEHFISADKDGYIRIHDLQTGKTLKQMEFTNQLNELTFVSNETLVGGYGYYDGQIKLWDINSNEVVGRFRGDWENTVSISADQKKIAILQDYSSGKIWEIETGNFLNDITCPDKKALRNFLFVESNLLFECGNSDESFVSLLNLISNEQKVLASGSLLREDKLENKPIMIADVNVDYPFFAKDIPNIKVVDVYENKALFDIFFDEELYYFYISDMEISSDHNFLALLIDNNAVLIWEKNNKKYLHAVQGHYSDIPYKISDIAFSSYGYLLASAGYDKTVRLWDASIGEELLILDEFPSPVSVVEFSPDGRYLIAGCDDGRIYVWAIE